MEREHEKASPEEMTPPDRQPSPAGEAVPDGKASPAGDAAPDGKTSPVGDTTPDGKPTPAGDAVPGGKASPAGRKSGKGGTKDGGDRRVKRGPKGGGGDRRVKRGPKGGGGDGTGRMRRNTAREIAVHLAYELSFTNLPVADLLAGRLTAETFASLAEEDPLYAVAPDDFQSRYITRLVSGVGAHSAELDGYIEKYAVGWKFARIPLMASAIMRVAMYEMLYMPDIPNAAAVNSAVDIAKKYETPETVRFINGILGTFSRQELA